MDLDRELHAAINVEPSPEFVARIRARVANAPVVRDLHSIRMFTACAAAVVIIAALIASWPEHDTTSQTPLVTKAARQLSSPPVAGSEGARPARVRRSQVPHQVIRRESRTDIALGASAQAELHELAVVVQQNGMSAAFGDIDDTFIPVAPMVVEVVPPMTDSEGVHQ